MTVPELAWLNDPMITQINRLEPHSSMHRTIARKKCEQMLDGIWKVKTGEEPLDEAAFEALADEMMGDISSFDDIPVPAHLQLHGHGQIQYTNTAYPWDGIEEVPYGKTPAHNLHAQYVLDFDLDPDLESENVQLVFDGVESAFYVWLNGSFVGYSTDSFTPAAFDVTSLLKEKDNRLCVLVFQFSSGSWLEDQDFFRFSGIFRSVKLEGRKSVYLEDFMIRTKVNEQLDVAAIELRLKDHGASSFALRLYDPDDALLFAEQMDVRSIALHLDHAKLWSAEVPNLYELVIDVLDENSNVCETIRQKVGIRHIEIEGGVILLNGKRLMLHGVNRHEFSMESGRVQTVDQIEHDVILMKQNNINALRTSHYPNREELYDLCDEYGLYVMDEANIETHGTWQAGFTEDPQDPLPGNKPVWKKAVMERAKAMFMRDKNHPSILFWSLGNESWYGDDLLEEAAWFRVADPDRLIHYESCFRSEDYSGCTDVISRMYASPEEIESILKAGPAKPVILCEYMHAMGNSLGGMYRYTRLEEYEQYQGGFIWDFADQALPVIKNGIEMPGYGGDFGDRPNNGNFSGNGIFFADRTPSAKLQEVKELYAPLRILPNENGVQILNTNLFTTTRQYHFKAVQKIEDRVIYSHEFDVRIFPGQYKHVHLDWRKTNEESVCTVTAHLAHDTAYAPEGYEIAFGQKVLRKPQVPHPLENGMKFVQGREYFGAQYGDIRFLFNQQGLVSIRKGEREWLEKMPKPVFSHAYTDNERGFEFDQSSAVWYAASLFSKTIDRTIEIDEERGFAQVIYRLSLPYPFMSSSWATLTYVVSAPGVLGVKLELPAVRYMPDLPVFGMEFKLPKSAADFTYYGYGPMENYSDRSCGARLDVFNDNAADNLQPYLKPQESGNRTGVRWLDLHDKEQTMRISRTGLPFEISVLPYSFSELQSADHQQELPASSGTWVRIAERHMGVGGIDSWGSPVPALDRLAASKKHSLNFLISFEEEKMDEADEENAKPDGLITEYVETAMPDESAQGTEISVSDSEQLEILDVRSETAESEAVSDLETEKQA